MKFSPLLLPMIAAGAAALFPQMLAAPPASSAMQLSGRLNQAGAPAAGEHEFRFQLFTSETGDTVVPKTQSITTTEMVAAGNWQTALDLRRFGGEKSILDDTVFPAGTAVSILDDTVIPTVGDRAILDNMVRTATQQSWRAVEGNWLQISVRRKGSPNFVPLSPRQRLGSVPRASTAFSAEHAVVAGSVAEGGVDGLAIAPSAIQTSALRDLAVVGSKIAPGSITFDKLASAAIDTDALRDLAVTSAKIAPASVVRSLNGLRDDVTLAAGPGVALNAAGNTLTISSTGTGGGSPLPNGNFLGAANENLFGGDTSFGVLGGGTLNKISGENNYSTLGGGQLNRVLEQSDWSFLGGGYNHQIGPNAANSTLGGGYANSIANGSSATIAGGNQNVTGGSFAAIGGGASNFAGEGGTVAGGGGNRASGPNAAVGGGLANAALSDQAVVAGGNNNVVHSSGHGAIVGGLGNTMTNSASGFVGGGENNRILNAGYSVVAGGLGNHAESSVSVIVGGEGNRTEGIGGWATALGGSFNLASGTHSIAAGHRAQATHSGSFVWSAWPGRNNGTPFGSERDGEFAVRAFGGARFETDGAGLFVDGQRVGGTGAGGGNGPITVVTAGGQTEPQARLDQTNPDDYVRLMMNTPRSFWTLGTGPNGWFSFYVPGQSPANTSGDSGANRFVITANGEVGVGSQQPFAQFHVRGRGNFSLPQARLTQENPQDFARLRLETGQKAWDIAAGPDGSLRFFGNGSDRLILGADSPQISAASGALTVNGRAVAFVDQLGQGGGQPGNGAPLSVTVAQGTALTGVSQDPQAGVGVVAEGRVGVRATSNSGQGAAIQGIQLNGSGYAADFAGKVKVSSTLEANGGLRVGGALRVSGLGDNTATAAFRLVPELLAIFSAANPGGNPTLWAILDHPSLNGNPNAMLMLTPVNASAYKLYQRSSDVMRGDFLTYFADAPASPAALRGRWVIDISPTPQGGPGNAAMAVFNALIVAP